MKRVNIINQQFFINNPSNFLQFSKKTTLKNIYLSVDIQYLVVVKVNVKSTEQILAKGQNVEIALIN